MNSKTNILVVDDQPDNLRTLSAILNGQGYKVRKALSAQMALETMRVELPDLILLDIKMPQMNGYELCCALKATPKTREIPVIFLSALGETADKVKAFAVGGADYITKPFQFEEVLARIGHQLTIQEQKRQLLQQNLQLQQEVEQRQRAEIAVQQLNRELEDQVRDRTAQLQRALEFEGRLKHITDKVRDSLDEKQILQAAVDELAVGLGVEFCSAGVCDPQLKTCRIIRQKTPYSSLNEENLQEIMGAESILHQLQEGYCFQFCCYQPPPEFLVHQLPEGYAILVCPIFDDRNLLGSVWLCKQKNAVFDDQEIRLSKQVANQCAIAIRQARLYQASLAQVQELEKLNRLKDDFLSTISHELCTPISHIKMTTQILMTLTSTERLPAAIMGERDNQTSKVERYLEILQDECDRELNLIQDLLDLQHLNAGTHPIHLSTINLYQWIPHIVESFELQIEKQQQRLEINLTADLPTLNTDLFSLSRILTELINNACKYTPAGGMITLSATTENDTFSVNVCNSGAAIPPEEISHIFDQFYRIPNNDPWKYGGTGLGLALVKKLAEYLGGSIEVKNLDCFNCFTLKLPYSFPGGLLSI